MSPLVSLICICLAVANAKPFYVVPTAYTTNYATPYTTNYATPYVFTQPKEFTGTQYRSFFPVQYVTGDVSNFPVTTKSETPFTFKTPVIATADTPFTFKTPVVAQPQVAFPFKTPVIAQPDTTFVFKTPVNAPETTFTYNTPVIAQPVVPTFKSVITPFAPSVTRYHAQNTDGSYTFGYSGGPSSRAETRDTFGRVNGVFNYVDPKGEVQTQQYIADNNGFRVAGTNLPVAPFAKTTGTETNVVAVSRKKREANEEFKTPASTVPLKKAYTPTYEVPTFVYPQTAIPSARASFTYPFNFYPNAYTVPATTYVQDNTIARSFNTENIPFTQPKTFTFDTTTDTKTFTGKSQPTYYSSTYPFFTYAPTNFVAGRNTPTPTVYSSTFPYTTFTNTNFDNTFTNKFVKPTTTGFSYVY